MDLGLALALLHVLICLILCAIQVYMLESTDGDKILWCIAIIYFLITIPFYMMLDTSVGYIFNKIVGG
jgi:hypothetical protein